uniref:ATP synthase F(0) complex subunit e, mitochondrial n=1 Tax=Echeneis naucrates TaxID=173247 RepID=A0A665VEP8_ECHNA
MAPPVAVSPLIKTARWSALLLGIFYGKQRFEYLKPIAEEERRIEEAEKKAREEQERIYKQLSEGITDTHSPSCLSYKGNHYSFDSEITHFNTYPENALFTYF